MYKTKTATSPAPTSTSPKTVANRGRIDGSANEISFKSMVVDGGRGGNCAVPGTENTGTAQDQATAWDDVWRDAERRIALANKRTQDTVKLLQLRERELKEAREWARQLDKMRTSDRKGFEGHIRELQEETGRLRRETEAHTLVAARYDADIEQNRRDNEEFERRFTERMRISNEELTEERKKARDGQSKVEELHRENEQLNGQIVMLKAMHTTAEQDAAMLDARCQLEEEYRRTGEDAHEYMQQMQETEEARRRTESRLNDATFEANRLRSLLQCNENRLLAANETEKHLRATISNLMARLRQHEEREKDPRSGRQGKGGGERWRNARSGPATAPRQRPAHDLATPPFVAARAYTP